MEPLDFKTPFVRVNKQAEGLLGILTPYWQRVLLRLLQRLDALAAEGTTMATTTESSAVVGITSGGGAGTKGSYETLIAATAAAAISILVVPSPYLTDITADYQWTLDVAVGAASSEVDLINDVKIDSIVDPGVRVLWVTGPLPKIEIAVPLGSRISARVSNRSAATKDLGVSITIEET